MHNDYAYSVKLPFTHMIYPCIGLIKIRKILSHKVGNTMVVDAFWSTEINF